MRDNRIDSRLLEFARELRKNSAPAERIMWSCLRDRRLNGFKFRRQYAFNGYVLDFYCAECRLVVELDGDSHSERVEYDQKRTGKLNQADLQVIRFNNPDVFEFLDVTLNAILDACEARSVKNRPSPSLSPEYQGEG